MTLPCRIPAERIVGPVHCSLLSLICLFAATLALMPAAATAQTFRVTFTRDVHPEPYTGRVYLFFSQEREQPRTGPGWFRPEQFAARDVVDWKPGQSLEFSARRSEEILAYPRSFPELKPQGYRVQAVVRFNPHDRNIGTGIGNGYSEVLTVPDEANADQVVSLTVDRLVQPREFRESRWSRLLEVPSQLLSRFHQRKVAVRGAVILPQSYYEQPQRRYPVIFTIPGFGGTHFSGQRNEPVEESNPGGVEFIRVLLDPSTARGHHVFADSANNGPWGSALVKEFIPALDEKFRTIPEPSARFLTGHSSGGWSSLWLQVRWPETFAGTWSTAPDPVDFRDFQRINLYQPGENMYVDSEKQRRPLARTNGRVLLWYDNFAKMEHVLGYGGQLHSFEAVFSPRKKDGTPALVWDRETGRVDTEVARTWEKYDIRLILERNWDTLGPKLAGKLHVFMGDADTFYLEGATIRLKDTLERLDSDAVVEIHQGKDHSSLMTAELRKRIRTEMAETFLKAHPEQRQ